MKHIRSLSIIPVVVGLVAVGFGCVAAVPIGNWNSPLEHDEFIYATGGGIVERINVETRTWDQQWAPFPTGVGLGSIYSSLVADNTNVYGAAYSCENKNCETIIFGIPTDSDREQNLLRTSQRGRVNGPLAISSGTLLAGYSDNEGNDTLGGLLIYDTEGLNLLSRVEVDAGVQGGVFVHGDVAYFGSEAGMLYAVDISDSQNPTTLWQQDVGAPVFSTPVVYADTLYVGSFGNEDNVLAINSVTGQIKWASSTQAWVWAQPLATDDGQGIYVADFDGMVYLLDVDDGTTVWQVDLPTNVVAKPTLFNRPNGKFLAVPGYQESVYVVNATTGVNTGEFFSTSLNGVAGAPLFSRNYLHLVTTSGQLRTYNIDSLLITNCLDIPNATVRGCS